MKFVKKDHEFPWISHFERTNPHEQWMFCSCGGQHKVGGDEYWSVWIEKHKGCNPDKRPEENGVNGFGFGTHDLPFDVDEIDQDKLWSCLPTHIKKLTQEYGYYDNEVIDELFVFFVTKYLDFSSIDEYFDSELYNDHTKRGFTLELDYDKLKRIKTNEL